MARVDSADVHFAIYFPKNNNSMRWGTLASNRDYDNAKQFTSIKVNVLISWMIYFVMRHPCGYIIWCQSKIKINISDRLELHVEIEHMRHCYAA